MDLTVKRWVGYGGLGFFVLLVAAVFGAPSSPSTNATAAKVVSTYHRHQTVFFINAYVIVAAVIVGLLYFWYLREYLVQEGRDRRLSTVAFTGGVILAVSGTIGAGLKIALADGSHAGNLPASAMQALNVLGNDLDIPSTAAGTALFLVVTGIVIVRGRALPPWLGWVAIVLGVVSVTGVVGPAGVALWVLLASITVLVVGRQSPAPAGAPTPAGAAAAPGR